MILTLIEKKILKTLVQRQTFMTTQEIADRSEVSWNTADRHLHKFHREKWIDKRKRGNRSYWKVILAL